MILMEISIFLNQVKYVKMKVTGCIIWKEILKWQQYLEIIVKQNFIDKTKIKSKEIFLDLLTDKIRYPFIKVSYCFM